MLDEPPRVRDGPIITPTVAKSIVGQAALQLGVMAALLGPLGEALVTTQLEASSGAVMDAAAAAAVAAGAAVSAAAAGVMEAGVSAVGGGGDRVEQYTLVFNSFVLMQLFNQVRWYVCVWGGGMEGWRGGGVLCAFVFGQDGCCTKSVC